MFVVLIVNIFTASHFLADFLESLVTYLVNAALLSFSSVVKVKAWDHGHMVQAWATIHKDEGG